MKNRIISLALCVISLAASIFLLTGIINKGDVVIKTPNRDNKEQEISQSDELPVNTQVELSEVGVSAFASRIEDFVTRMAYENDKSYESDLEYILQNTDGVSNWLRENSYGKEADYYKLVAEKFEALSAPQTDAEFSEFVSNALRDIDSLDTDTEMCPQFDTEIGGSLTLALLAVNDAVAEKSLDKSSTFTVTVGGGALLGDRIGVSQEKSFKTAFDKSGNYSFPFYKLSPVLANDDLSFITLLAPLTESSVPAQDILDPVKGLPYYAQSLFGIDCVSIAPSEMLHYGETGYDDTVRTLSENGISYSVHNGSGYRDTAYGKVVYISVDLTDTDVSIAQKDINKEVVKTLVTNEQENGADLIVLQVHWNTRLREDVEPNREINADYVGTVTSQYEQHMDAFNKEIAREAIRAGADLVVGTGSHVLQGIEQYQDKYIVYSPGNLTYSGNIDTEQPNTAYAYLFRVTFEKSGDENKVLSSRVVPVVNNSTDSPLLPTPVFDERAENIVDMLVFQSSYFTDAIKNFDYIKITK